MMAYRGGQSQKHVPVQKWESSVTSELQMQKQAVINAWFACWFLYLLLADSICLLCLLILCLLCLQICMLADIYAFFAC